MPQDFSDPLYDGVFLLDVEATTSTPMSGVMTEFGIVHLLSMATFYGHLYRASPHPENPAVPAVETHLNGEPIQEAYSCVDGGQPEHYASLRDLGLATQSWVHATKGEGRPVLVSDNNGYDAMWFNCFTDLVGIGLIFGHSSRRIGDYYAGMLKRWNVQSSWKKLRRTRHTHHPLDDALGNAEALRTILGVDVR